mgnify:CR=1 FL=1
MFEFEYYLSLYIIALFKAKIYTIFKIYEKFL